MTLYLTKPELKLYDKLLASVKQAWGGKVEEETGTAWETDEQQKKRISVSANEMQENAQLVSLLKKYQDAAALDADFIRNVPEEVLGTMFYIMGARGMSVLMEQFLQSIEDAEQLDSLASLSAIRHGLLKSNALLPV